MYTVAFKVSPLTVLCMPPHGHSGHGFDPHGGVPLSTSSNIPVHQQQPPPRWTGHEPRYMTAHPMPTRDRVDPAELERARRRQDRVGACVAMLVIAALVVGGWWGWDRYGAPYFAERQQEYLAATMPVTGDEYLASVSAEWASGAGPAAISVSATPAVAVDTTDSATEPAAEPAVEPVAEPAPEATPAPEPSYVPPDPRTRGEPVATLRIPKIDFEMVVVHGVGDSELAKGPGWMPWSVMPGMPGNSAISAHRTSHGGTFRRIDELAVGDRIEVAVPGQPLAVYEVRDAFIVSPDDVWVTTGNDGVRLTLSSCHPVGSTAERYVVQAELVEGRWLQHALPAEQWQRSVPT